ncbi:MAG: uncharacterized membrane protein YgdD (TMEM256/DUF423 family) [Planctomycetota bacterium]|jgi:uncharacterized membrane protein YgdD (TMEM256/DUF423 family)
MSNSNWKAVGALLAGVAVAAGAFGAHALHDQLEQADQLGNWETAVRYQVWHALALILFAVMREQRQSGGSAIGWLFLIGTVFFSGSLYALALGIPSTYIWPLTPAGGLLLLVGWLSIAVGALRSSSNG